MAVTAIAAEVWEGHDYLPAVFDGWLADREGLFCAATVDGRVAGVAKLSCLAPGWWWMEGLRVGKAFRGRGLGRGLHRRLVDYARAFAPTTVAYSTAANNAVMIRMSAEFGFRQVATYLLYGAPASDQPRDRLQLLTPADLPAACELLAVLVADSVPNAPSRLLLEDRWRFVPLVPTVLRQRLAESLVYGWRGLDGRLSGLAVLNPPLLQQQNGGTEARLYVGAYAAHPDERAALAVALRGLAWEQGFPRVSTKVLDDVNLLDAVRQAGYEQRSELQVQVLLREFS